MARAGNYTVNYEHIGLCTCEAMTERVPELLRNLHGANEIMLTMVEPSSKRLDVGDE